MGRALGLRWDLVGRRVQSVMLHAMRLRLALVGLTAQVDLTAPVVLTAQVEVTAQVDLTALVVVTAQMELTGLVGLTAQVDLTAPVVLTALGPTGARRRDRVWLTRHIMHTHAR